MNYKTKKQIILTIALTFAAIGTPRLSQAADGWVGPISDEYYRSFGSCGNTRAVAGMQCMGRYCDNVYLFCKDLPTGVTLDPARRGRSNWFSDEYPTSGGCEPGWVMTGLACAGSYCDNMQVECTAVATGTFSGSYVVSGWFSEEQPAQYFNGRFAVGLTAHGSYADNLAVNSLTLR